MNDIGNVREMGIELLSLSRKFNEKLNSIENKVNNLFENYKSPADLAFSIQRYQLRRHLSDLRSELDVLVLLLDEMLKESSSIEIEQLFKKLKRDIENFSGEIKKLENRIVEKFGYLYENDSLFNELSDVCIESKHKICQWRIEIERIVGNEPLYLVFSLITQLSDWPGLNDRWICAACYLAALEIVVNKACKAWNIRADSFEKKLEKVVRELRKRDENLSKVEKKLIKTIYDLRGKILHSGYIPKDKEYERIVADIPDFIEKVKKHIN